MKQQLNTHFSRAAACYDTHALLQQRVAGEVYPIAQRLFPEGALVLDAGCGTGGFAKQGKWQVVNLDLAYGMCAKAAGYAVNADMEQLPLKEEAVEGVFSCLALQWAEDKTQAFEEFYRVLKPGSHLVATSFCEGTLHEFHSAIRTVAPERTLHHFDDAYHYVNALKAAGFSEISFDVETIKESVPNVRALMEGMKAIGAHNKTAQVAPSKDFFARVEQAYRTRWENPTGTLPVTWNVLTLTARKAV
jgi:malonyl-CoA O-methyltransferase